MRKLIIALLIPVFHLASTSADAVTCETITSQTTCNTTIGCFWSVSNIAPRCSPCPKNTYSNGRNIVCARCGANSSTNAAGTGCNCNPGYHIINQPNNAQLNNNSQDCVGNTFSISYETGNASCFKMTTASCTYGATNCMASYANNCTYTGYTLLGWTCDHCTTQNLIKPGTQLNTISNGLNIKLTAQWQQCPAGSYCSNVSQVKTCPAGSTSDAGSTSINDCYMQGGTTKICDNNNNCFTLPGTNRLPYTIVPNNKIPIKNTENTLK